MALGPNKPDKPPPPEPKFPKGVEFAPEPPPPKVGVPCPIE